MTVELPLAATESRGWVRIPFPHPAWMSTRAAGDMREPATRDRFLASIGIAPEEVLRLRQVHSTRVLNAEDLVRGPTPAGLYHAPPEADGLVSAPGGPYLAVGVGDCVPILLCDRRSGAYGVLHSGWRGTGILREGVRAMHERYGSAPSDLVVFLGPCISVESYVVDEARAAEYRKWGARAVVQRGDRPYLDMRSANTEIAETLGVGSVTVADHCTVQTPQLGSFRREGPGYTGMLVIVGPCRSPRKEEHDEL